ncbi:MAG: septum formation initiator family protein [Bacteroidales bacterium]|nr:septum formation initiator family protein [Bacteroidales bacterium]
MVNIKDNKIFKVVTNKYFVTLTIFLILILFVDENNLRLTRSLKRDVAELQRTVDTLKQGIVQDSIRAESLVDDMDSIERYGREKYYMKRESEDVFVVQHANQGKKK